FCRTFPKTLDDVDRMFTRNAIWIGRTQNVGSMGPQDAINYSLSGPLLRASGVAYDVRKHRPYLGYENYDFDVPVGEHGDCYDRYIVRMEEMRQSVRILEQALVRLERLKGAPINVSDPRLILPPKSRAMSDMEAMIFHFKQVVEGVKAPPGRGIQGNAEPQGGAGLLLRVGRDRQAGALANPSSVFHQPGLPAQALRGRAAVRRDRDQRQRGHRHGRDRPMSSAHVEEEYQPVFVGEGRQELEAVFPNFPTKMACLLPALWIVQRRRGWISEGAIAEVAEVLGLTPAYVKGVVTFY